MSKNQKIETVIMNKFHGVVVMDQIRAAMLLGGNAANAAGKVSKARTDFEALSKVTLKATNNGETRIKNCYKYDLGNGYRLVTIHKGSVCIFLYFGDHDSAQKWLNNHQGLKVTISEENEVNLIHEASVNAHLTPQITHDNIPYLERLDKVDWESLILKRRLRRNLLKINETTDHEDIADLIDELQEDDHELSAAIYKVINHLAKNNLGQAQAHIDLFRGATKEVSEQGNELTTEVIRSNSNSSSLVELSNLTDEEWEAILDPAKFQEWMVFLHPGQKRVVDEDFDQPALLTGIPGSGKTCVLVHRARRLAKLYPGERILVLTLNKNLATLIEQLVNQLCTKVEARNIHVQSFHDYLSGLLGSLDIGHFLDRLGEYLGLQEAIGKLLTTYKPSELVQYLFKARDEEELITDFKEFLKEAPYEIKSKADRLQIYIAGQDGAEDVDFYLYEELELVRSAFEAFDDYKGYASYERKGRSIQFHDNRRKVVLKVLKAWEDYQLSNGFLDHMGLCQTALLAIEESGDIPKFCKYRSVLVDEFQDFSTLDLRILKRIPTQVENGLFITGDFSQKLYAKELDLTKAGLGLKERTNRSIRQNYRNSRQVLEAAHALIQAYPPELSEEERRGILKPEYAKRESAIPRAIKSDTPIEEAWRHASDWQANGNIGFSICIATANREKYQPDYIIEQCPSHLRAGRLKGDYFNDPGRIIVSDIASIKGFEFSLVIIVGMGDGSFPLSARPEKEHWRDALRLHVAISRARDEVIFVHQDSPSPFLLAMEEFIRFAEAEPILAKPEILPEEIKLPIEKNSIVAGQEQTEQSKTDLSGDTAKTKKDTQEISSPTTSSNDQIALPNSIQIINGFPICSLPKDANQRVIAQALGRPETEITVYCQQHLQCFVTPIAPLQKYRIEMVLQRYGCLAHYTD